MYLSVFNHKDYKEYLISRIDHMPQGGRGTKSKWARAIRCQPTYVSQILHGLAHLSLEQADALNRNLGHTADESHFFILLVQLARAGTPELREYFLGRMEIAREMRGRPVVRIGGESVENQESV